MIVFLLPTGVRAAQFTVAVKEHKPVIALSQQLTFEMIAVNDPVDEITVTYTSNADGSFDMQISPRRLSIRYRLIVARGNGTATELISDEQDGSMKIYPVAILADSMIYSLSATTFHARIAENPIGSRSFADIRQPLLSDGIFSVFSQAPSEEPPSIGYTTASVPSAPDGHLILSPLYTIGVTSSSSRSMIPLRVKIGYTENDSMSRSWYTYDQLTGWNRLASYNHVEDKTVEATLDELPTSIALLADGQAYDGIASWYSYKNCLCAASTVYPKGTFLKVTRLKTGTSVVVRVNDYGPEKWTGRLIDLDKTAFKKIGATRAGLIYVRVEPL